MKIALFNVKYSPNLGDGVIAECLEHELARRTGALVYSIDLAGRTAWTPPPRQGRTRALKLAVLNRLPPALSDRLVSAVLEPLLRQRMVPHWRQQLAQADMAVFGGGQLLQDGDLNFPLKIAAAARLCAERDLPLAVFAVGATPSRSRRGRQLFETLLHARRLLHAAARDESSRKELASYGCAPVLCRDPGLLAASLWPAARLRQAARRRIGLGITHPAVLAHHGAGATPGVEGAVALFAAMAQRLAAHDFDVVCFTNGAGEDEYLLALVRERLEGGTSSVGISFAGRCEAPRQLAELIAGCDAIVAHRLHACIIAYAYGRPALGLRWDAKLDAFFDGIGHGGDVLAFDAATAGDIAANMERLLARGIDEAERQRVIAQTRAGIDALANALLATFAERQEASA